MQHTARVDVSGQYRMVFITTSRISAFAIRSRFIVLFIVKKERKKEKEKHHDVRISAEAAGCCAL
jgi:hypothetical protein